MKVTAKLAMLAPVFAVFGVVGVSSPAFAAGYAPSAVQVVHPTVAGNTEQCGVNGCNETLSGRGYVLSSFADCLLLPTGALLGETRVTSDGFDFNVRIPPGLNAGSYTIQCTGDNGETASWPLLISSRDLPAAQLSPRLSIHAADTRLGVSSVLVAIAAVVVAFGGLLISFGRRKRSVSSEAN